jgi:hypothetical protein
MRSFTMHARHVIGVALLLCLSVAPVLASAATFPVPDGVESVEIGSSVLGNGWEPSGIVWHVQRNSYIVVSDDGVVAELSPSGDLLNEWTGIPYDLEGVTFADASSSLVYLAAERKGLILEFDLSTGSLTQWVLDVSPWLGNVDPNQGLEGLTFVPDGVHPYGNTSFGGVFYASLQENGVIYIFSADGDPELLGSIDTGMRDTSGLSYDEATGYVVAIHDAYNLGQLFTPSGALVGDMDLPGDNQEGVATHVSCPSAVLQVTIAEDAGSGASEVWVYGYADVPIAPVNCPDETPDEPEEPVCIDVPSDTADVQYEATTDCQYYVESNGRYVFVFNGDGERVARRYLYRKVPGTFDLVVTDLYSDGVDDILVANMPPKRNNGRLSVLQLDGTSLTKTGFAKTPVSSDRTAEIIHVDDQFGSVIVNFGSDQVMFGVYKSGKATVAEY